MITIGNVLFFIIGVFIGSSIMYGFDVYMDWKEDREKLKKEEAEEYKRTHRNANKPARLIPESFDTYRDGIKKKLHCKKCSMCNYLYALDDNPETCIDCGALFKEDREHENG